MTTPRIAILSFPGTNCEVESVRAIRRAGMTPVARKWNDPRDTFEDIDGYFLPGGFSYEDRGRSGMIAARDPVLSFLAEEAQRGKPVIGNCNGAQILIESGLLPLGDGLRMSIARNALPSDNGWTAQGFLNEWIHIAPACDRNRCVTSNWSGVMAMPMAHGEGRFTTNDPELLALLQANDQIAFRYCDPEGNVSDRPDVTPNGSLFAIAGLCNPAGNVVALMPHPERTVLGDPYFHSMREWIVGKKSWSGSVRTADAPAAPAPMPVRRSRDGEIFIAALITDNEERTVEQALRRLLPSAGLKQYRYILPGDADTAAALHSVSVFNPKKEIAFVRSGKTFRVWDAAAKALGEEREQVLSGVTFLRRESPDTGETLFGTGSQTGICYDCRNVDENALGAREVLEILCNPHAGTLERIAAS